MSAESAQTTPERSEPVTTEHRLKELGITLPAPPEPFGAYAEAVQTAPWGLSSQKLTAAVSNFGGLGSFGTHSLAPHAINDAIAQIRSLTSKSFAINLWVSIEDDSARTSGEAAFNRSLVLLRHQLAAPGAQHPAYTPYAPMLQEAGVDAIVASGFEGGGHLFLAHR